MNVWPVMVATMRMRNAMINGVAWISSTSSPMLILWLSVTVTRAWTELSHDRHNGGHREAEQSDEWVARPMLPTPVWVRMETQPCCYRVHIIMGSDHIPRICGFQRWSSAGAAQGEGETQ